VDDDVVDDDVVDDDVVDDDVVDDDVDDVLLLLLLTPQNSCLAILPWRMV